MHGGWYLACRTQRLESLGCLKLAWCILKNFGRRRHWCRPPRQSRCVQQLVWRVERPSRPKTRSLRKHKNTTKAKVCCTWFPRSCPPMASTSILAPSKAYGRPGLYCYITWRLAIGISNDMFGRKIWGVRRAAEGSLQNRQEYMCGAFGINGLINCR